MEAASAWRIAFFLNNSHIKFSWPAEKDEKLLHHPLQMQISPPICKHDVVRIFQCFFLI
ncbi:hypothetical protein ACS0TY_017195 [Phlomoides rotata]